MSSLHYVCVRCSHPVEFHDRVGCTWIVDEACHDYCPCTVTARDLEEEA